MCNINQEYLLDNIILNTVLKEMWKWDILLLDYAKAFDHVDHNKLENSERNGHTICMPMVRPPDLPLEKPVRKSGSNNYNWTWNNRLVPNRKRSMSRLYIVTRHI